MSRFYWYTFIPFLSQREIVASLQCKIQIAKCKMQNYSLFHSPILATETGENTEIVASLQCKIQIAKCKMQNYSLFHSPILATETGENTEIVASLQ
jgi:hypothetical protein